MLLNVVAAWLLSGTTEKHSPDHPELASLYPGDVTAIRGREPKGTKLAVLSGREGWYNSFSLVSYSDTNQSWASVSFVCMEVGRLFFFECYATP